MNTNVAWRVLTGPFERSTEAFRALERMVRASKMEATRYECGPNARAMLLPLPLLPGGRGSEAEKVLFISVDDDGKTIWNLLSALAEGRLEPTWPDWAGVQTAPRRDEAFLRLIGEFGLEEKARRFIIEGDQRQTIIFDLYRLPPATEALKPFLSAGLKKIPEGPHNLERRARWFKRRTRNRD